MARRVLLAVVIALTFALVGAALALADGPNVIPIAGGGLSTSDPNSALHATFSSPQQVAVERGGEFYERKYVIADYDNCVIREVSFSDANYLSDVGTISTVVGSLGSCGNINQVDGAIGTTWQIDHPTSVSATSDEQILIADSRNQQVDSWSAGDHKISRVAGIGLTPCSVPLDGVVATSARFCSLWRVAADPTNPDRYLILDQGSGSVAPHVYLVEGGLISTAAVGCASGPNCFVNPLGIAWVESDAPTHFLVTDVASGHNQVLEYTLGTPAAGTIVAGTGAATTGDNGDGGPPTSATFAQPADVVMTTDGGYYVADRYNCVVRKITDFTPQSLIFSIAGGCRDNAPPDTTVHSSFEPNLYPYGLFLGPAGLYVVSNDTNQVELIERTTIASGPPAFSNVQRPSFTFNVLEGYGNVACSVDGDFFDHPEKEQSCGESTDNDGNLLPYTVPTDLADGPHTFYVCAAPNPDLTDPGETNFNGDPFPSPATSCNHGVSEDAQNPNARLTWRADPTPAFWRWTVDRSPPTGLALTAPDDGAAGQP